MGDAIQALREQLHQAEANLRLIRERQTQFVLETDVPLQLIKDQRRLEAQVADLSERLERILEIPCPYRGLQPFEAMHAAFYFGRETMVERLVTRLRETPFAAVVGPSGCGKSSLVRAGLVTALRGDAIPNSRDWIVHIFCPGRDPLRALATPLVSLLEPEASEVLRLAEARRLADHLRSGTLGLQDVTTRLLEVRPDLPHIVLVADQFEELYTECEDKATREAFVCALVAAAEAERFSVVMSLRADFFGRVLADCPLGQRVDRGLVSVLPMNQTERRSAIERPALATGRVFEPGLVERILDELANAPGELPLLEFALTELWASQTSQGLLTHEAYEDIGRVRGAIAKRAESVYLDLEKNGQGEIARRILLRLSHYGEGIQGTRRRVTLAQLITPGAPAPIVEQVSQVLADARLVVLGRDDATGAETLEMAHEALIDGWERLRRWLEENRSFGLWRERLAVARRTWEETGQDEGALLRGAPLVEAHRQLTERFDDLNANEQRYIRESLALHERGQAVRKRDYVLFCTMGGIIGGGLGGMIGGIADCLKDGTWFVPDLIAGGLGSAMFGAIGGGAVSIGSSLGWIVGRSRRVFLVIGGAVAGMLPGALVGWLCGQEMGIGGSLGMFLGILWGTLYGGGIAASVVIGRRVEGATRHLLRAAVGAAAGGLVCLPLRGAIFIACVGIGTAVALGYVHDRTQPNAVR
jgi:hypothetical protein